VESEESVDGKRIEEKAPEYLDKLLLEIDEYWSTILWAMADGKKTEYDALKRTSIFEFYPLYDRWLAVNKNDKPAIK
jgi:hypothetical protein